MSLNFSEPGSCYELVPYKNPSFPIYVLEDFMSQSAGHKVVGHYHADFELVAVLSGSMDYFVNGRQIVLKPGEIVFTSSRQFHYASPSGSQECRFISLLFHPSIVCSHPWLADQWMSRLISPASPDYFHFHDSLQASRIMSYMEKAAVYYENSEEDLRLVAVLYEILDFLIKETADQQPAEDLKALKQFRCMNDLVFNNPGACVEDLAASAGIGITRCTELFRRYTGMPPARYCALLKLKKAEKLLLESDLNQTEIALECGYASSSYFCQCFKKEYGISPLQYRKGRKISRSC